MNMDALSTSLDASRHSFASRCAVSALEQWDVSNDSTNATASTALRLGGQNGTAARRFTGQIDEVRVFQGSLSPSAMTALSAAASPCAPLKIQLLTPANNTAYNSPATIELTAIATNTNGPVSIIEYLNGSTVVG